MVSPTLTNGQKTMIAFGIVELILIIFICLATFYTPLRVAVTGKTASSRQDAKNKGFGYYSDPINGQCFSQTGNCQTEGSRFVYRKCIPNFNNGNDGTGCIDGNSGLFTYNMIIDEEPCKQQCFVKDIVLDDNVDVNTLDDGTNIVTAVGTHKLVDNITGFDMSSTFIGDFDLGEMNYKLKNCIPGRDRYQGYKVKKYECKASSDQGMNGCIYMCGSDATLTYGRSVSLKIGDDILFPYYTSEDGRRMFYCKDINDNNQVQALNYLEEGEDIPSSFVFPDVCYSHVYTGNPPNPKATFTLNKQSYNYIVDDPYLFVDKDTEFFQQYFNLNYTILSDPHTYTRLFVNGEWRLLSRFYEGSEGITSFTDLEGANIGYVPYPAETFNIIELRDMEKINIKSDDTGEFEIEFFKDDIFEDSNFIYVPFEVKNGFFDGVDIKSGRYFYDPVTTTIKLYSDEFELNENVVLYMRFDNEPWLPRFQPLSITDDKTVNIDFICGNDSLPENKTGRGTFSYYSLPDVTYTVSGSGVDPTFATTLPLLPLTGNMFVDNFITPQENIDPKGYVDFQTVSNTQPFYIFGTPLPTFPDAGERGFYYPLFLSKHDPDKNYTTYKFEGYQNTSFYLPIDDNSYSNARYVYGNYSDYNYLRGTAIAELRFEAFKVNDVIIYYWCNPQVLTTGTNYELNTYYKIRGKDARVRVSSLTDPATPHNVLETARAGNEIYQNVSFIGMLEDQNRNTTDNVVTDYSVTIYPEKTIELTYDFRPLKGPYIEENGVKNYICSNPNGTPKEDGIEVDFNIGQTLVANVINNDFNTDKPAYCGQVTLPDGSPCIIERNPSGYNLSSGCIVYNPEGNYRTVEDFFEPGFLFGDGQKLTCYSGDGSKTLDDSNCQQTYLTDYWIEGKKYSPNEELLLNKSDVKLYISLVQNNTTFPDSDNWGTVSEIEETYFNVGQYLGEQETYIVQEAGDIHMKPGRQIRYLTSLDIRLPSSFDKTDYIDPSPIDVFKDRFDIRTPYTSSQVRVSSLETLTYSMRNTDPLNPVLKVLFQNSQIFNKGKLQCDKLYLEENYLNGLIWFLTTYEFFKTKSTDLPSLEGVNFCVVVAENHQNILSAMNSTARTTLTMTGTNQADLTGYYCWFVPLVYDNGTNDPNLTNALYPIQWMRYIRWAADNSEPCKFEVVKVVSYSDDGNNITFVRNITDIPEDQRFRFISLDKTEGNTECGFFLPFSKVGPLPRVYTPDETDGSFQISLSFPSEYLPFIDQILNTPTDSSIVDIYNTVSLGPINTRTFFNYGFNGFVIDNNIQSPSYTNEGTTLVQYEPSRDRNKSMSYVQRFRLTPDNKIYFNEVKDSNILTYRIGDYITLIDEYIFIIVGTNKQVVKDDNPDLYEKFDYQCEPLDAGFYVWYNNENNFVQKGGRYNRINNGQDWITLPVCKPVPGQTDEWRFVMFEYYNFKNDNIIITTSAIGNELTPISPDVTITDSSFVFYLGFIPATAPEGILIPQRNANAGRLNETRLYSIRIDETSVINVEEISGKPAGRYSITDSEKTTYSDLIRGRSFITDFSVTSISTIEQNLRYSIDGYNFGIETGDLASVNLLDKTYTVDVPTYDGSQSVFNYGDLVYFKDYKTKLLFRNRSDTRQEFNPDEIDDGIWESSGKIHPQVDYKLYHEDQVYNTGDIVRYDDELWQANVAIGLGSGRKVPEFSNDWDLFVPSGTLFSTQNYYLSIQGDMDPDNPSFVKRELGIIGQIHQFPVEDMYYNRNYRYILTEDTPMIYFSSNSNLLDEKYNFISGNFIMEIKYYLSGIETTRVNFMNVLEDSSRSDEKQIDILIRRSASSLLLAEEDYEELTIEFGSDETTSPGELTFFNNNRELTEEILKNNRLDNQNIPFRIGNFGDLGYCMGSCIKNIDNDPYSTTPFSFIDLISSDLVDTYFGNNILSFSDSSNFLALSNEPCDITYSIEDRFLQICDVPAVSIPEYNPFFSQYVYQLPKLSRAEYGVNTCGSESDFIFANALLWIYVPLDIDSQNFLKYKVVSKTVDGGSEIGVINSGPYFQGTGISYTILNSQTILKKSDGSYTTSGKTLSINRETFLGDFTYLKENGPFTDEILRKNAISMKQVGGDNKIILKPKKFGLVYTVQDVNYDNVNNYDYWWASAISRGDTDRIVFSWGFVYNQKFLPLSFTDDLDTFEPQEGKMDIYASGNESVKTFDLNFGENGFGYKILDFEVVKQTTFSSTEFIDFEAEYMQNLKVQVEFDEDGYMYQPGDNRYSSVEETNLTVGDDLYFKLFGDKCLTKIYSSFGDTNTPLSYYPATISGRDGLDYLPLVFNMNKSGVLSMENEVTGIQSGNQIVQTTEIEEIFMIDDGVLRPNPVNLPFNLNHNSSFKETYIRNRLFGVIASGSSSDLYTEPFTNFTPTVESNVTDFPLSLNDRNLVLANSKLRKQMLRLKNNRARYPDEGLICNFILQDSLLDVQQGNFATVPGSRGLTLRDFGDTATVKTNLYFSIYQNVDGNFPISFLVNGNIITSTTTSYSGNQYLTIQYYLDELETSQQNYVNPSNFNKATDRYIRIVYETPLTTNTDPTITTIGVLDASSENQIFEFNIVSND